MRLHSFAVAWYSLQSAVIFKMVETTMESWIYSMHLWLDIGFSGFGVLARLDMFLTFEVYLMINSGCRNLWKMLFFN